jgi:hypothetical protein
MNLRHKHDARGQPAAGVFRFTNVEAQPGSNQPRRNLNRVRRRAFADLIAADEQLDPSAVFAPDVRRRHSKSDAASGRADT